eukprot:c19718_g1_i3 orf=581-1519(+)
MLFTNLQMFPSYCFGGSLQEVVLSHMGSRSFHFNCFNIIKFRSFNSQPKFYVPTVEHLQKSSSSSKRRVTVYVVARSRKGGKEDNGGDKVSHFGPLFVNGNAGIDCPVPSEQQPVNEYKSLLDSVLFSWAMGDLKAYCLKLLAIGAGISILLGWPVVTSSINPEKEFMKCVLGATCGGLIAVILASLRMYLGWSYVGNRLLSATVEYEETGWYDGEVWVKPPEVLTRDRLLGSWKVKPALDRVKLTLLGLAISLTSCILFLNLDGSKSMLNKMSETLDKSYGSPYNDASAQLFEPGAFAGDHEEVKFPDICY